MVAHHYTTPDRLAIMGGSNGGLLMGAALTQHPEFYRAVVSMVGVYAMLRVEDTATSHYMASRGSSGYHALQAQSSLHLAGGCFTSNPFIVSL